MKESPPAPLTASASFFKGHGHGNDYLVFEEGTEWPVEPERIRLVCDRHRGVGADGIVVLRAPAAGEVPVLRMFNPDGSAFERSGNGLRIAAAYLYSAGRVRDESFPVLVGGEEVRMRVLAQASDGALQVRVDMGQARFGPDAVDMEPGSEDADEAVSLEHPSLGCVDLLPVSVGNPHAVCFRDRLQPAELTVLGPWIATHPGFRSGTNVQLAHVEGPGCVSIHIWERGVGRTSASGTSACAAAAAAVRSGRTPPGRVRVCMEGGDFDVTIGPDLEVRLEGPVWPVLHGTLAAGLLGPST